MSCLGCEDYFFDDGLCLTRVFFEVVTQCLAYCGLDGSYDFVVAEFGFCLSFKLRFEYFYGNDSGKSFAEVVAGDLDFGVLEEVVVLGVFFQSRGQAAPESCQVCAAFDCVDVVYVGVYVLVVCVVVGEGYFDGDSLALCVEVYDVAYKRFLAGVDVFDEFAQAVAGEEYFGTGLAFCIDVAHIGKGKRDTGVEECKVAQAFCEG